MITCTNMQLRALSLIINYRLQNFNSQNYAHNECF